MSRTRHLDAPGWHNPAPYARAYAAQLVRNFAGLLDAGPTTIAEGLERLRARSDGRVVHAFVWLDDEREMVTDPDVLVMALGVAVWMLGLKGRIEGAPASLEQARLVAAIWGRDTCSPMFEWTRAEWAAFAAIPWRWSAGVDSRCTATPDDVPAWSLGIPRHMHEPAIDARALS